MSSGGYDRTNRKHRARQRRASAGHDNHTRNQPTPPGTSLRSIRQPAARALTPGTVAMVWVPFEDDPAEGKSRPAIIIATHGRDVVVAPLTTSTYHDNRRSPWGAVPVTDWEDAGLLRACRVVLRPVTVDRGTDIGHLIGHLSPTDRTRILAALPDAA